MVFPPHTDEEDARTVRLVNPWRSPTWQQQKRPWMAFLRSSRTRGTA